MSTTSECRLAAQWMLVLAFYGMAYSLFSWLVIDKGSIWQAATAPEAIRR